MLLGHKRCGGLTCKRSSAQVALNHLPALNHSGCKQHTTVCKAEPLYQNGPISVNPSSIADPLSASSQSSKAPITDRSKGLWTRCEKCGVILYIKHLKEHNHICYSCNFHLKMSSAERIEHMIDPGTWRSLDDTLSPMDPLDFVDLKAYPDRIKEAQDKTGMQDGLRAGTGLLHGIPVALGVMEFGYMGGSMGSVVGEKLTRLIEYATQEGLSLIIVSTSGGARMQEGIFSLMQMAKISGALHVHQNEANLLFISVLTSPTTGGVTASFGMLGDIIVAEPGAIIGFAGRRVIEQTLQEQLPDDFQTAEYLLNKGLLDLVIPRSFLKGALFEIMDFYKDAPYKKQGRVPFGVQHGIFHTTEEKIRRKYKEWSSQSSNGKAAHLNGSADHTAPSYKELVSSMRTLLGEQTEHVDMMDLMKDEVALAEALATAKSSKIEWVQQQSSLLGGGKSQDRQYSQDSQQYMFRLVENNTAAAQYMFHEMCNFDAVNDSCWIPRTKETR